VSRTGIFSVKQPVLKLLPRTLNIAMHLKIKRVEETKGQSVHPGRCSPGRILIATKR
jgi:hypothetical protein